MIRLNDKDNSRINEKSIDYYITTNICDSIEIEIEIGRELYNFCYETKEARDKDIELLDKIFDVKSIEDKANAYPHEIDVLNYTVSGIKKENEPVKEEYITWEEVEQSEKPIKAQLPNGETHMIYYDDDNDRIEFIGDYHSGIYGGCIYDEDLFNALKLKKCEGK
jgi:hypothetical protein